MKRKEEGREEKRKGKGKEGVGRGGRGGAEGMEKQNARPHRGRKIRDAGRKREEKEVVTNRGETKRR